MADKATKTVAQAEKKDNAPKKSEAKKRTKSSIRFIGPAGELVVVTNTVTPNNIQTYVVHIQPHPTELNSKGKPKKIRKRGISETHPNLDAAVAAVKKIADQAVKMGWVAKVRTRRSRADAFDLAHLPAPVLKPTSKS